MDQIEKFIEAQKLKNKSQNNYEKNYGASSGRALSGLKLAAQEDTLGYLKNRESVMGAISHKKKSGASHGHPSAAGLKGNYQHLEVDEKWSSLSKKEKDFCIGLNLKPSSYCTFRRQIQLEVAKNRKITQSFLDNLQTKNKNVSQAARSQIPLVFEFMVHANIISPF